MTDLLIVFAGSVALLAVWTFMVLALLLAVDRICEWWFK